MDKNKIDTQTVCEMFEELNKKLDKQTNTPSEPIKLIQAQVDTTAIDAVTERLKNVIEEVKKPNTVEHHHRYAISIASNCFFLSMDSIGYCHTWIVLGDCQSTADYQPIQRQ
jgi:hypothetical protein